MSVTPNEHWALSEKMPGWAVCFDEADTENFLHKMLRCDDGAWVRRGALSNEELVMVVEHQHASLQKFKEVAQRALDQRQWIAAAQEMAR